MNESTNGAPDPGDADRVAELLGLELLPEEGGRYRRTHLDVRSSAIYYLLGPDDASALHRLPTAEVWHHYVGAPVRLLTLHPDGRAVEHCLGPDLESGARPQVIVPGGVWQGAVSTGSMSLLGTTMAPPFDGAAFELGDAVELTERYPQAAQLIDELVRRSVRRGWR